jgi:hypothetical protein
MKCAIVPTLRKVLWTLIGRQAPRRHPLERCVSSLRATRAKFMDVVRYSMDAFRTKEQAGACVSQTTIAMIATNGRPVSRAMRVAEIKECNTKA